MKKHYNAKSQVAIISLADDPKLIDPPHEGGRLKPERDRRIRCSVWSDVCMLPQLVFHISRRKYLDTHQATEIVGVNIGPVGRLNLKRLSMPDVHNVRFHNIQLTRRLQVDIASIHSVIKRDSGNRRCINLVCERPSPCGTQAA